jgi:hypothetical protein
MEITWNGHRCLSGFSRFKSGETLNEDCECSGSTSTGHTEENVEKVYKTVHGDRHNMILEIVGRLSLSYRTLQ